MLLLDLTLPTPEENLALDEALLDEAEAGTAPRETLRLWEPATPAVVLGRSSQVAVEVHEATCREQNVSIVRRASGGAAIVTGPGCLMYAVVLSLQLRPGLRAIDVAHNTVLAAIVAGLHRQGIAAEHHGTSDLTLAGRKFSGNSLRVRRDHLLYHGTLLYNFPLELIAACLGTAPRQPAYRAGRSHDAFVTNLPLTADELRSAIIGAWEIDRRTEQWPRERVAMLVAEKHSRRDWVFGR